MLQLPSSTLTREVYWGYGDFEDVLGTLIAMCWTLMIVPIAFGLWFHSWWVWFAVLILEIIFMLIFFFIVNSYALASISLIVFSLFWGATGYFIGAYIQSLIGCAPPPLILGVFFCLISFSIFIFPLFRHYH